MCGPQVAERRGPPDRDGLPHQDEPRHRRAEPRQVSGGVKEAGGGESGPGLLSAETPRAWPSRQCGANGACGALKDLLIRFFSQESNYRIVRLLRSIFCGFALLLI